MAMRSSTPPAVLQAPEIAKVGHDLLWPIGEVRPSPENDEIYHPIDREAPDMKDLARSVHADGVIEPIVVTPEGEILSGHRRYAAACMAGLLQVPVRIDHTVTYANREQFVRRLREYNRQRVKSLDEMVHEAVIDADPAEAYSKTMQHRADSLKPLVGGIDIRDAVKRKRISPAKAPLLAAIQKVIADLQAYWPLSVRQIHYGLLNDPPLIHAGKKKSRYANNLKSYKALIDLAARGRLDLSIAFEAIADETRPVSTWNVHSNVQDFCTAELNQLMKGYWRNLQRSQPSHIEIVGEKNTVSGILSPVAAQYTIPLTLGRGFCSLPPRRDIVQRFRKTGKDRLIILIVSDFDPEGNEIAHSLARSIRDDFGIQSVEAFKVAVTREQIDKYKLPPGAKAKKGSSRYARFIREHGDDVYELEALPPTVLQDLVRESINSVMDIAMFNREVDSDREDSRLLEGIRVAVHESLKGLKLEGA